MYTEGDINCYHILAQEAMEFRVQELRLFLAFVCVPAFTSFLSHGSVKFQCEHPWNSARGL